MTAFKSGQLQIKNIKCYRFCQTESLIDLAKSKHGLLFELGLALHWKFGYFCRKLEKKLVKLVGQIVSQKHLCHKPRWRSRRECSVAMFIIICERAHKIYIKTDTYSKFIVGSYDMTRDIGMYHVGHDLFYQCQARRRWYYFPRYAQEWRRLPRTSSQREGKSGQVLLCHPLSHSSVIHLMAASNQCMYLCYKLQWPQN